MLGRLLARLRRLVPSGDGGDDDGDTSVWDLVPSWQYSGRYAESGGLARDEQERALRDIQEQAAEREDHEYER